MDTESVGMRNSGTAFTWDFLREKDRPRLITIDQKSPDSTYVLPDLIVVCDTSKLEEKGCLGAPDSGRPGLKTEGSKFLEKSRISCL